MASSISLRQGKFVFLPSFDKVVEMKGGRKLIGANGLLLDYDPPGANPAHDPPAPGKRGGRGGNP